MNDDLERLLPEGWTLARLRDEVPLSWPELLPPSTHVVDLLSDPPVPISATIVIDFAGLYLVLDKDRGQWWMGQQGADGSIGCWGLYGSDLETAIRNL